MTDVDVVSTTAGYFPRPDYLIETLKEVEGYQKDGLGQSDEVVEVFDEGRDQVMEIQRNAGIDLPTEGQLAWDDIIVYPATRLDGVEMNGIIRYYDNNRFYRRPIVQDAPEGEELTLDDFTKAREINRNTKAVMAGPYSLADLSEDEHYGDEAELALGYADVVNDELRALDEEGVEVIQLDEPSLTGVKRDEPVDVDAAARAVGRAVEGVDATVVVNTFFGDVADIYPHLLDAIGSGDGVGLDLVEGRGANLEALEQHGAPDTLGAGVMDARNTRLESTSEIGDGVRSALERASSEPDVVHAQPNTGLDFLPWAAMEDKVERLGNAVEKTEVV